MEGYRELELFIGPLQEWKGMRDVGAIRLVCNGNRETIRIDASVSKSIVSTTNTATLNIYNLSADTRHALERGGTSMKLYAGYEGEAKALVFSGSILRSVTERQGTDIITTVHCLTGAGPLVKSATSKTFTYGVPVAEAVRSLASTIPGIILDPTNINVSGQIGYAGWSFVGPTKEALDKLAYQFGFSWSINDGKFIAVQDGKSIGSRVLLTSATGLRKVSPRLTSLWQIQEGVDIQTMFYPGVNPYTVVRVRSEVSPEQNNGDYVVHTIEYNLAPKSNAWDMDITSFTFYGGGGSGNWING